MQQFLQRDNFAQRHARGDAIWLHEFFYALMQAYDAVALGVDIQVGGTEQLFNLMAGRKLQEVFSQAPLIPITLPILVGTDGHQRMSKTTGNYIAIADSPEEQYGKTMSLPDEAMSNWFQLLTPLRQPEIDRLMGAVAAGTLHPMTAKKRLAHEIVTVFHDTQAAATSRGALRAHRAKPASCQWTCPSGSSAPRSGSWSSWPTPAWCQVAARPGDWCNRAASAWTATP